MFLGATEVYRLKLVEQYEVPDLGGGPTLYTRKYRLIGDVTRIGAKQVLEAHIRARGEITQLQFYTDDIPDDEIAVSWLSQDWK